MSGEKLSAKQLAALKRKEKFLKNSDNRLDRITGVHKGKSEDEINDEAKAKEVEIDDEEIAKAQIKKSEKKPNHSKPSNEELLKKKRELEILLQSQQSASFKKLAYSGFVLLLSAFIGYLYSTSETANSIMTPAQLFSKLKYESVSWEEVLSAFPKLSFVPDFFSVFFLVDLLYLGITFLTSNTNKDQISLSFLKYFFGNLLNHTCLLILTFGLLSMVY
eukprot:NODE_843_length_3758_cov_0.336977.p2 type:complete len:219 gc:universal NODE_843_length_3758_cov_0.336977:2619-1963(-)